MAQDHVYSGFFNSIDHDRKYDANDFNKVFDGIVTDGIFKYFEDSFKVEKFSGFVININAGRALFNNTWTYNDAIVQLDLGTSEPTLKRKDAVVLEINTNYMVRQNSFKIIKGEPSNNADDALPLPTITRGEELNQYPLYYIIVRPNTTEIDAADIIDNRGSFTCPYSHAIQGQNGIQTTYGLVNQFNIVDAEPEESSMEQGKMYFIIEGDN